MRTALVVLPALLVACTSPSLPSPEEDAGTQDPTDAGAHDPVRTTVDQPDDAPDAYQVHVLYVEPSDRTASAPLDTNGAIRRSVAAFNAWFAKEGAKLRFDTKGGVLDVTYVKLAAPYTEVAMAEGTVGTPAGPAFLRDRLENLLKQTFKAPKKLYLVYWDGLSFGQCGSGPYPPALPGHMSVMQVGGIFLSSFLDQAAALGATTLQVHATSALPLPATPFAATLGSETVNVTQVSGNVLTLQQGLTAAHAAGEVLKSTTTIPDCRANPFSSNGQQLNYWEFTGAHELMHPLGIVPADAADFAASPVAPGHLSSSNPSGTADLMYQGTAAWGCAEHPSPANAAAAKCRLDSGHRNYFKASRSVDLAKSAFLDPTPAGAVPPPAW